MNAYTLLEPILRNILPLLNPSKDDWSCRFYIINELKAVVETVESLRGATVEPYGSFVSNLFSKWDDLDITIELENGSHISSAGKKRKQSLLADVQKALRRKGGWRRLQLVPNARVPILKLESHYRNILCDVSIDNLSGQMKSKLLFWINEIDGRFRNMVKEWAKTHNINDSKAGTLNSYSLYLLVIFHFQTCEPALLPPLKEIYPGNLVEDLTGVRTVAEKRIEEICAVNINRFRSDKSRQINCSSLAKLFVSFLAKFSDIGVKASKVGINLYTGQWEDIETNMKWLPKTYALFVEDPFEQPLNTARSVSSTHIGRISEAFETTYQKLTSVHQNQSFLVAAIARPHISQYIAGTRGSNSNYSRTGPQNQRAVPLPFQLESKFKNIDVNGHSSNVNRPIPTQQGQVKQRWQKSDNRNSYNS